MRGASGSSNAQFNGQPIAVVLIVLIAGATIFMWRRGQLRSRAGLVTIAGIIAILVYIAFSQGSSIS
jgi:phage-related holin